MKLIGLLFILLTNISFAEVTSGTRVWLQERSDVTDLTELLGREGIKVKYEGLTEELRYQVCVGFEYNSEYKMWRSQEISGKLPELRNRYAAPENGVYPGCDID